MRESTRMCMHEPENARSDLFVFMVHWVKQINTTGLDNIAHNDKL